MYQSWIAHLLLLNFEARRTSYFKTCDSFGWPHLRSNGIMDCYYRMYSFHFDIKFTFSGKSYQTNQFSNRNYIDSLLESGHSIWPPISKLDMCLASILFGFCITMHYPVLLHINGLDGQVCSKSREVIVMK